MRTKAARATGSRLPHLGTFQRLIRRRPRTSHNGSLPQPGTTLLTGPSSTPASPPSQSDIRPSAVTVAAWLDTWLTSRARVRDSTRRGYQSHVRCHLRPRLRGVLLTDLDVARLQRLFADMLEAGTTEATVRRVYCTLRSALNAAVREKLITDNPARYLQVPAGRRPHAVIWTRRRVREWQRAGDRPPVAVWTTAQTRRFLKSARGHRLFAAYQLIALRGLRRGEACGLCWADLDLDAGLAYVTRQVQHIGGKLTACPLKTPASRRAVALDPATIALLRAHRSAQQRDAWARGITLSGYVFTAPGGGPLCPENLTRTFNKLVADAGLPPVRLHDLRHGAATLMLLAGADLKTIADQLGHSSIVLTADTYLSVAIELGLAVAAATARLILRHGKRPPGGGTTRRRSAPPRATVTFRARRLSTRDAILA
jgi:integrase